MQSVGLLQSLEWFCFDRMVQWRLTSHPDDRILVVAITEADIQSLGWPLPDRTYAQLLAQLQKAQPRVIGLDIYRERPYGDGHTELQQELQAPNVITITSLGGADDPGVPPPPQVPPEQVGFNDVPLDTDSVIRRNLLFMGDGQQVFYSFGLRVALAYLAHESVVPQGDSLNPDYLRLGSHTFVPLQSSSGAYVNLDDRGYQILLDYRSSDWRSQQVTVNQVLSGTVPAQRVRDKIVLIGSVSPYLKDLFETPYRNKDGTPELMPGVVVHAQMVSQIVRVGLSQDSPFWFWPDWGEWLWLGLWGLGGTVLLRFWDRPLYLGGLTIVGMGMIVASGYLCFLQMGWIPTIAPVLAFGLTGVGGAIALLYRDHTAKRFIQQRVEQQDQMIAELHSVLASLPPLSSPSGGLPPTAPSPAGPDLTILPEEFATGEEVFDGLTQAFEAPSVPQEHRVFSISPSVPRLKGRYKIIKPLSSGGFGITYLAEDMDRPRNPLCVVKKLSPLQRTPHVLSIARRLFITEAEILEFLGHHDQIPQLLAFFEEGQDFFLVEEYIPGNTLLAELPVDQRCPSSYAVQLLRDLLGVLAFVHSHHVVHRDIKPSNILRRAMDGQLVLIDFGSVKPLFSLTPDATVVIGTPGYAAPEQLTGQPHYSSDLYSLGMIAIQALTGISPQILRRYPTTLELEWQHLAQAPPMLVRILDRMTRYTLSERYQSATEVLHDLRSLCSDRQKT